jgi:hypothetical protein
MTDNPWADNPASITPRELLELAIDALEHWPEERPDTDRQHPEDAYAAAVTVLRAATGLRTVEWLANRPGRTSHAA